MTTVSVSYTIKYVLDFEPKYGFSEKQCFNLKTGRRIKQVYSKGSIGYCINGQFNSLNKLRKHLIKPKEICPF
jgi:hypothetical protein